MSNIFSNRENGGDKTPWDPSRKSIYDAIASASEPIEECGLPDDGLRQKGQTLNFAPGATDALFRSRADKDDDRCERILTLLNAAVDRPSAETYKALYEALAATRARGFVQTFCRSLAGRSDPPSMDTAQLFRYLARNAPDREVVKIAIAVIGLLGDANDEDLLWTLGQHNEFTHLASEALFSKAEDPEHSVWTLSKRVNGWGRIKTVERLRRTKNMAIKHWLVRDGYKNTIMYQYLAGIAVITGDLVSQLQTNTPDDALLDGTADILSALVFGGPCPDISTYREAATIYELFLEHNRKQDVGLKRLVAITRVTKFLTGPPSKRHPPPKHWSADQVENGIADGLELLAKPTHIKCVKDALETGNKFEAMNAHLVAKALGLDLWETTFRRAARGEDIQWFVLLDTCDQQRMAQIISLVEDIVPLSEIATGPTKAHFPKHNVRNQRIIDHVAQDLRRFPGLGWNILDVALQSPVVRIRNMAIAALNEWAPADLPKSLEAILKQAIIEEPDPKVEERLQALMTRI